MYLSSLYSFKYISMVNIRGKTLRRGMAAPWMIPGNCNLWRGEAWSRIIGQRVPLSKSSIWSWCMGARLVGESCSERVQGITKVWCLFKGDGMWVAHHWCPTLPHPECHQDEGWECMANHDAQHIQLFSLHESKSGLCPCSCSCPLISLRLSYKGSRFTLTHIIQTVCYRLNSNTHWSR